VAFHLPLRPLCGLLLLLGCEQQKAPSLASLAPAPLEPLAAAGADGGTDVHRLAPAPAWGAPLPTVGVRVLLRDEEIRIGSARFRPGPDGGMRPVLDAVGRGPALLVAEGETYLAQVAPLLAALDDAHVPVWLLHEAGVAFPLRLRDERAFDAWLDDPKPGKLRVVQRQDGLELVSGVGKLPGPDPNGPTVPVRGGRLDIATARQGLSRLQQRFRVEEACLVPSFGTELRAVATALTAFWVGPKEPLFAELCLVYPRPR
jgi:hypothetical protein